MSESQEQQAQVTCLRLLTASPKSRWELEKKLLDRGYSSEIIAKTLAKMEEQGILNDTAFAKDLMLKFTNARPSGSRKIGFELKRHGISKQIRQDILESLDPEAEKDRARQLGWGRWSRLLNQPKQQREKRVYDLLVRRGFDFEIVRELIGEFRQNTTQENEVKSFK